MRFDSAGVVDDGGGAAAERGGEVRPRDHAGEHERGVVGRVRLQQVAEDQRQDRRLQQRQTDGPQQSERRAPVPDEELFARQHRNQPTRSPHVAYEAAHGRRRGCRSNAEAVGNAATAMNDGRLRRRARTTSPADAHLLLARSAPRRGALHPRAGRRARRRRSRRARSSPPRHARRKARCSTCPCSD